MRRSLACLLLAACRTDTTDLEDPPPPPELTTWYQDVGPIVANRCMGCHREGGLAPFSLETYDDAALYGMQMLAAVEAGEMPPWSAVPANDCAPTRAFKHDPRLTDAELATLRAWIADDRPAGQVATLMPSEPPHLANATHELVPVEPFVTSGDTDQFKCFALDPGITTDQFLSGWDVIPGNRSVVHHVVLQTLPPDLLQAARNADVIGKPLDCPVIPMSEAIGAWAPGQGPTETPDGVAARIPPNTGLLMQIHYHPANQVNAPDATAVHLRMSETPPSKFYAFGGWGNARTPPHLQPDPTDVDGVIQFRIPAGASEHVETMRFPIAGTGPRVPMFIMQPHQHYVGTRLELRIHRTSPPPGEPADECLINSDWDFSWQRTYQYDVPIAELPTVGPGDEVEVRCTYNNTLANPYVELALHEQGLSGPVDVLIGEQTLDEMCLGLVGLITDGTVAPPSEKPQAPPLQLVGNALVLAD